MLVARLLPLPGCLSVNRTGRRSALGSVFGNCANARCDGWYPSGSPVAFLCLRAAAALTRTVRIGGGNRCTPTSRVRTMMEMAPVRRSLEAPHLELWDPLCPFVDAKRPRRCRAPKLLPLPSHDVSSSRAGCVLGPSFHCSRQDSPRLDPGPGVGYLLHIPIDNSIEGNTDEYRAFGSHWHTRRAPVLVYSAHLGTDPARAALGEDRSLESCLRSPRPAAGLLGDREPLEPLGLHDPRAFVVNHREQVLKALDEVRIPLVIKPNVGGSGADIVQYATR